MNFIWKSPKDPNEVKDFGIDYTRLLGVDTIDTSVWSVVGAAGSLALGAQQKTDTSTTVWISGGTTGLSYRLLNRITTTGGRIFDRTVQLDVRDT